VAVAVVLFVLALWFSQAAAAAIVAIYPVIFSVLPLGPALVVAAVVSLAPLALEVIVLGPRSPEMPVSVAATVLGMVAALVVGTVIVTSMRQRARLEAVVSELEASRAETDRLSRAAGVAAERERLAREIHDTLAQGFTSIVALAQAVEAELDTDAAAASRHVELIRTTARENLAEALVMVAGLTPPALGEDSLVAAVRRQCDRLAAETGIAVSLCADPDLPALGMAVDVVLLRATQEAFANIRKHAQASAVGVEISIADGHLRLSVVDNGVGLADDHPEGYGLRGMRARVAQVGGTMTVSSPPGGGVNIEIAVPA
jgi:signal transduction histidine kinase